MLDDIKGIFKDYAPPIPFAMASTMLIWGLPSRTQTNWPIVGEFVMDSALKGVLIAICWFLFFSFYIAWKLLLPKRSEQTYECVRAARDYVNQMDLASRDTSQLYGYIETLGNMEDKIPKGSNRKSFHKVIDAVQRIYGFQAWKAAVPNSEPSDEEVDNYLEATEDAARAIVEFKNKVEWSNNA